MCSQSGSASPPNEVRAGIENESMQDDPALCRDAEMTAAAPPLAGRPNGLRDQHVDAPLPGVPLASVTVSAPAVLQTPVMAMADVQPASTATATSQQAASHSRGIDLMVLAASKTTRSGSGGSSRGARSREALRGIQGAWKCPQCATRLTRKADLVRHERRVHQKLKPFVCSQRACRQRFGERFNMRRHERCVHQCTGCGRMAGVLHVRAGRAGKVRRLCWRCRAVHRL